MRLSGKDGPRDGAQQGIGRAIAVALAHDGADVASLSRRPQGRRGGGRRGAGPGRRTVLVPGDVSRRPEVEAMVATIVKELGVPDVVINNAGVFPRVAFLDDADSDWDHGPRTSTSRAASSPRRQAPGRWWRRTSPAPSSTSRPSPSAATPAACTTPPARPGSSASRAPWPWRWRPTGSGSMPSPPGIDRHRAAALRQHRGAAGHPGARDAIRPDGDAGRDRPRGRVPRDRKTRPGQPARRSTSTRAPTWRDKLSPLVTAQHTGPAAGESYDLDARARLLCSWSPGCSRLLSRPRPRPSPPAL